MTGLAEAVQGGAAAERLLASGSRRLAGESDGSFSVTWGFGYSKGYELGKHVIAKAVGGFEDLALILPALPTSGLSEAVKALAPVDELIGGFAWVVGSERFRRSIAESWLAHQSGHGFTTIPPLEDELPHELGLYLRRKRQFPIRAAHPRCALHRRGRAV